jgi:hypothetical protein
LSQIESTYKARDTEETLDIYFYRPLGYYFALFSKIIGITPNMISIMSIIIGVIAGHLFYYNDPIIDLIGIIILIFSETLDSADGQLARMTKRQSKVGRILDGLATGIIYLSIYIHICLRMMNSGTSAFIFVLAVLSGLSHSFQSAMADYYRNAFMKFVSNTKKDELDKSSHLRIEYKEISWKNSFFEKFFIKFYINYTTQQEMLVKNFLRLLDTFEKKLNGISPQWLKNEYHRINKPLIKYYNILTTNTRMIVLIISLLIGRPFYYFVFEFVILNLLLVFVLIKQDKNNRDLKKLIEFKTGELNA